MFARYKHCILLIFVMIIFSGHFVQGGSKKSKSHKPKISPAQQYEMRLKGI
ncbi:unnamed protein product, partial [Tenebrio molitor]